VCCANQAFFHGIALRAAFGKTIIEVGSQELEPEVGGSNPFSRGHFGFFPSGRWLMVNYDLYGVSGQRGGKGLLDKVLQRNGMSSILWHK
jgi:hypothetical protein